MNNFAANTTYPTTAFGAGLVASQLLQNSPSLSRLGSNCPACQVFPASSLVQTQPLLQLSLQLLEMLTNLMVGGPNALPSPQSGPNAAPEAKPSANVGDKAPTKGGRIPGGKSLYARKMFHKGAPGAPNTYAFENSPAGIKFAAQHNYSSIDIDMQITKDGVPVATHWSKPMSKDGFYDPLHKLSPKTKVSDMTLDEVMRLRNKDGQSRIYPLSTMLDILKQNGIAGDLEAKDDPRFATDEMMGKIAQMVRQSGIKANLKSIDRGERSTKILKKAQEFGFWVRTAKAGSSQRKYFGYA